jgi:hypothetical protein
MRKHRLASTLREVPSGASLLTPHAAERSNLCRPAGPQPPPASPMQRRQGRATIGRNPVACPVGLVSWRKFNNDTGAIRGHQPGMLPESINNNRLQWGEPRNTCKNSTCNTSQHGATSCGLSPAFPCQ